MQVAKVELVAAKQRDTGCTPDPTKPSTAYLVTACHGCQQASQCTLLLSELRALTACRFAQHAGLSLVTRPRVPQCPSLRLLLLAPKSRVASRAQPTWPKDFFHCSCYGTTHILAEGKGLVKLRAGK